MGQPLPVVPFLYTQMITFDFVVVNSSLVAQHPKTDAGIRTLVLTPDAKKYIKMALDENKANGRSDEDYIFLSKSGERMHEYAVNNVLRRCNGVRNEKDRFIISGKPSGNHAIRKTCISELHDSQLLLDRMISDFAGHKDISTTQKYYIHSVTPLTANHSICSLTSDYGIRYALRALLIARPRLAYKDKKEFVLNASIHPNSFFVFPVILGNSCGRWDLKK